MAGDVLTSEILIEAKRLLQDDEYQSKRNRERFYDMQQQTDFSPSPNKPEPVGKDGLGIMTRKERRAMERAKEKHVATLMRSGFSEWTDITDLPNTKELTSKMNTPPFKVMMNGLFIVQMFKQDTSWGEVIRLMIRWNDARPVHDWSMFQRIKNELVGEDRVALEVYPKSSNLVDVANMYWLFVLPAGSVCPIEMQKSEG